MNRNWLRSFLHLGARADRDLIPTADILRQENTVLAAWKMLRGQPGLALADEVGMGKTFEALGIAACVRHEKPKSRIVVITPGPDLNAKWLGDIDRFREMYDFGQSHVSSARSLRDFVKAVRTHPIVLAPVTMFRTGRARDERAHLLALYCRWKEFHHHTTAAIFRRVFPDGQSIPNAEQSLFLDAFTWEDLQPHLKLAFHRGTHGEAPGLEDLYTEGTIDAFEREDSVRRALYRARFELCGRLLPKIDLLIVDEAHKLKNPGSLQTMAMQSVFEKRFRKVLLLTATPFQLDVGELRQVFSLFSHAISAPANLMTEVKALLDAIKEYQQQYETFQQTWMDLDPLLAKEFTARYEVDGISARFEDANLNILRQQVEALCKLKDQSIEPGLRKWMIRSLRPGKREYRRSHYLALRPTGHGVLPFLIYERFIAELFWQRRPTHKASVEINMVSSYSAAVEGSLMNGDEALPPTAEAYRELLKRILPAGAGRLRGHPKLREVVAQALAAAQLGEKSLIFCSRTATVDQLRREIDEAWEEELIKRWDAVYPGSQVADIFDTTDDETRQRGRHSLLQARFHRPQDALFLALREPCLREKWLTVWAFGRLPEIVAEANELLAAERLGKTAAERVDYAVMRKCIARAAAYSWQREHPLSDKEVALLEIAAAGERSTVPSSEPFNAAATWTITDTHARTVIGSGASLWSEHVPLLSQLPGAVRARVVEQVARYLTYKQVPFLAELLSQARAAGVRVDRVESSGLLDFLPGFWVSPAGLQWIGKVGEFVHYLVQQGAQQQETILEDLDKTRTGGFVRHTRDGDTRERLRELFNTPLYPMVLVANAVMQEGLDLHKQCRRVIHHDLTWNPAEVEQRIGRIDRLGSLASRLRAIDPCVTLDVLYPVIRSTIDERLYRTVKTREKWLEFLLGAQPEFTSFTFSNEIPPPIPDRLAGELAIRLSPV